MIYISRPRCQLYDTVEFLSKGFPISLSHDKLCFYCLVTFKKERTKKQESLVRE